jgi:hypothetical protein
MKDQSTITRFLVLTFLILFLGQVSGQDNDQKLLLRNKKVKLSTFYAEISPSTSWSRLNDQSVSVFELSGGLILNNSWHLGFFMTGSPKVNKIIIPEEGTEEFQKWIDAGVELYQVNPSTETLFVQYRHSGLKAGYMHKTYRMLFWRTSLAFGFSGGLNMSENQSVFKMFKNIVYKSPIMSFEPDVGLGINLLNWWRIYLDVGYRFLIVDEDIFKASDTDSFTFKLSFGFGNFGYKK